MAAASHNSRSQALKLEAEAVARDASLTLDDVLRLVTARRPNGSFFVEVTALGDLVFTATGHPAQSFLALLAKRQSEDDSAFEVVYCVGGGGDHSCT